MNFPADFKFFLQKYVGRRNHSASTNLREDELTRVTLLSHTWKNFLKNSPSREFHADSEYVFSFSVGAVQKLQSSIF